MGYDVVVIGAGVSGAMIARELSRYSLDVCVIEKQPDVAMGSSMANSAIVHAGFDAEPGTLKAKLNVQGNALMEQVTDELCVPYKKIGAMVICLEQQGVEALDKLYQRGIANSVPDMELIDGDEARRREPNLSKDVVKALVANTSAIVCPFELTIAAMENAMDNGAKLMLDCPAQKIDAVADGFVIHTPKGEIKTKYIVNAAGIYSDEISALIGDNSFTIRPRKGEYLLMDKQQGNLVSRTIFQQPTKMGKGILLSPTVDNNLIVGPTSVDIDDKEDKQTTAMGLENVAKGAALSVPSLNTRGVIRSFTGLRSTLVPVADFIIEPSKKNKNFIQCAGIESPGLSSAPAIAKYTVKQLEKSGLELKQNEKFNPRRRPMLKFAYMDEKQLQQAYEQNHEYAKIVCRCEKVTKAEIVDCIHRNCGATTLDGVKRRTRAGMGRCQGGFCSPTVVDILAKELGKTPEQITKKGGDSWILCGKVK